MDSLILLSAAAAAARLVRLGRGMVDNLAGLLVLLVMMERRSKGVVVVGRAQLWIPETRGSAFVSFLNCEAMLCSKCMSNGPFCESSHGSF
jgi:hypothetical protein